jgi:hypothetical protein
MARDQALGRLGIVWHRLKQFYADLMLLSVDTFRKNRAGDVEIPLMGAAGEFESKWIRLADLKGNIQTHPEADETVPRQKSQQRAVLQHAEFSGRERNNCAYSSVAACRNNFQHRGKRARCGNLHHGNRDRCERNNFDGR